MNPMGRIGEPDDIAQAIAFLLSPQASFITGQTIGLDGGQGIIHPLPRVVAGAA
jgi:NAD(P)-dependent dehydrogenase (short-subunit alcohol dehydrogenase family)